jgi:hypothetical protein
LAASVDPAYYLEALTFTPFPWQQNVLRPGIHRLILNCARQSGKSTVIAAKVVHRAKYFPGSLIMLFAPTENQATELMEKISIFMSLDEEIILVRDSSVTKKLINGSRIRAFSASPKSSRGYSDPDIIVFDEAAQVDDELYLTVRPMMTGGKTDLILLSTPFGKEGFFYEIWHRATDIWTKILVKPPDIMHEMMPNQYKVVDYEEYRKTNETIGIDAYISPRHKKDFLLEEFEEMGEKWYMQEYGCEFINKIGSVFDMDVFQRAYTSEVTMIDLEKVEGTSEGGMLW